MIWMMEHCVEPYFSFLEAATILGVDRRVLLHWQAYGKLKPKVIEGKNFIRLADLESIVFKGTPNEDMYMKVKKIEQAKLNKVHAQREARLRLQRQLYGTKEPKPKRSKRSDTKD
jgi:hypothetical protein